MEKTKTTARDFFLHIAVIALLYTGTVALLNILFRVINVAFPQVDRYFYMPSISLPVATLIVVFPLFLFIANFLQKSYAAEPEKKEYAVRKWLIYITLFLAGAVLAGDLITTIYYFLDGRELTAGFLLKSLSVLVVIGCIFGYYIDDLKGRLSGNRRTVWRVIASILVVGSIVLGFSVLGTPQSQREIRYDSQKVSDLQSIQWQVVHFWQMKGALPDNLSELEDPLSNFVLPKSKAGDEYVYEKAGGLAFKLCAQFDRATDSNSVMSQVPGKVNESWNHPSGYYCFDRVIDPDIYRPITR